MKPSLRRWTRAGLLGSLFALGAGVAPGEDHAPQPVQAFASFRAFSGIHPHLATFNSQNECGTGAVVPWAERLWVITYSPHEPGGSDDKLYEIRPDLTRVTRPESVGGTPANRLIHRESRQLFLGPYVIDAQGRVRVIPPERMFGRLTGTARHLFEPADKVYTATMEEGFYEVDVRSLAVRELYPDANRRADRGGSLLPGYHGKGLYSGQGRLIYANNGEHSAAARRRPDVPSGVLATWDGRDWSVVQRKQFTEVTGPGGLTGNAHPETDPVWSIGWDHRSLILMLLDHGTWHRFRLPKASHCYDGAHGWNTEWPRIRDIGGGDDWLMTMHGMFWHFPRTFAWGRTAGIRPRSTYLKVVGDFARWGDRLVLGCDDAAKSEFLNTRRAKGRLAGPAQSQSNLWFLDPATLDRLGPPLGRGGVWIQDAVAAGEVSDPFLIDGFDRRGLHLIHDANADVTFTLEVDRDGRGTWQSLRRVTVPAAGYRWEALAADEPAVWLRVRVDRACRATVYADMTRTDLRPTEPDVRFAALPPAAQAAGARTLLRAGTEAEGLHVVQPGTGRVYRLRPDLQFVAVNDPRRGAWLAEAEHLAVPRDVLRLEGASVLYVDDDGRRFRLPLAGPAYRRRPEIWQSSRVSREVCTERDLFQAAGILYELPARNAGGFAQIRPIATQPYRIEDYTSWRGLLVLSGADPNRAGCDPHVVVSTDGDCALWLGAVDDLWSLGRSRGWGGPWYHSEVKAGEPSDPYLLTGFGAKRLTLSQEGIGPVTVTAEVDITGTGLWVAYQRWTLAPGRALPHRFPRGFNATWIRFSTDRDTTATALLSYE